MNAINFERINLKNQEQREQVQGFLKKFNLILEENVDYTIVYKEKGIIKATASKTRSVFKCFAVSEELRGTGITALLLSNLLDRLFEEGMNHSFIFTKPEYIKVFSSLNYKLVHEVSDAALLENGTYNIEGVIKNIEKDFAINLETKKSAIILSSDGLTSEAIKLIEKIAEGSEEVLIFIADEDIVNMELLKDEVDKKFKNLKNVKVIFGVEYILSVNVFPKYFIRDNDVLIRAFSELRIGIFKKYFCNSFNIDKIYICEENSIGIFS